MKLSAEQRQIATQRPNGHFLLKGVAGSGKTLVGLYRALFLSKNYCVDKDDVVLLATYNRTLVKYMEQLYARLHDVDLQKCRSLFNCPNQSAQIQTIDSLMVPYFNDYVKERRKSYSIGVSPTISHEIIRAGIAKLKPRYTGVSILAEQHWSFLLQEIQWIKASLLLNESEYLAADRRGMMPRATGTVSVQGLPKASCARKAVFALMQYYTDTIRQRNLCTFEDMRLMALWQVRKTCRRRFCHLIVDESQDLTRSQLLFLKEIYHHQKAHASILFMVDTAQNIYPQSWLGSGRSFTSVGFNMSGRSYSLSKSHRCTARISQAAHSLIDACPQILTDEHFIFSTSDQTKGDLPVCRSFSNLREQADFIAAEIKRSRAAHPLGTIAVLARFKNQLEMLQSLLMKNGIHCGIFVNPEHRFQKDRVTLITLHSIKGLEFNTVFICGVDEGQMPYLPEPSASAKRRAEIKERKLLYVGMTRAMDRLYLLSGPRPSPFFKMVGNACRRAGFKRRFGPFYAVNRHKYHFVHQLGKLTGVEEKLRQWLIAELVNNYGFPLDCIAVDRPMPDAHAKGYVDLTVSINRSGAMAAFIFFEILRQTECCDQALNRVKAFMRHSSTCRYAVVSNGRILLIIDRSQAEVEDIPVFNPAWRLSSAVRYLYRNLKTDQQQVICLDPDDPTFLEMEQDTQNEILNRSELEEIQVYGSIAAGAPLQINAESEGVFFLPKTWCRGGDYYILKTSGDSMDGAAIGDGDWVLVRSQSTAANMDIAVVSLENQGAIKRLRRNGNKLILQSENPRYESIEVTAETVSVLGIAVGVLRPLPQAWKRGRQMA